MTATQQKTRGREYQVLVEHRHDRRWRRITITASAVRAGRSSEAVAAAEQLFAAGLPGPDQYRINTAPPNVAAPQLRRNEDG